MSQGTVKIVRFYETGGPEVLKIEDQPLPEPGKSEVRLRVKAIGLNRAEVMFRRGMYLQQPKLPSTNGYEASGVVEALGEGVDQSWLGKTVSTVPAFRLDEYGVYGEVAIVPVYALAEYPSSLSYEEGTSIWMQYITAWGGLVHLGKMSEGEFVVITAASSSVGIAAIEMAKAEGAISIAVTRTQAKSAELKSLGADQVVVTDEEDLVTRVNEITGGKGARLIFDPIGGPIVEKLAAATAYQGVILEYGGLSGEPTPFPLFRALSKSLTIRGYTLFEINSVAELRTQAERYVFDKLKSGAFKPRIAKIFELSEIVEAHRYMESNQQIGKIVVTV